MRLALSEGPGLATERHVAALPAQPAPTPGLPVPATGNQGGAHGFALVAWQQRGCHRVVE